jgi:hypothetical protein
MLYRPALHGNWKALRLAKKALKEKFPKPIPLTAVLPNHQIFLPDPVNFLLYLAQFSLEWEMFRTKLVDKKNEFYVQ